MAVAEAIRAAGLGCDTADLEPEPPDGPGSGGIVETVSCDVGDDTIAIHRFADHAALVNDDDLMRQGVCFSAANQPTNLTYVRGPNWIVFPEQASTARRIGAALGVGLATVTC